MLALKLSDLKLEEALKPAPKENSPAKKESKKKEAAKSSEKPTEAPEPAKPQELPGSTNGGARPPEESSNAVDSLFGDSTATDDFLGTHFTCFTGTKVQILTHKARLGGILQPPAPAVAPQQAAAAAAAPPPAAAAAAAAAEAPLVEEAVGPNAVMHAGVKLYISISRCWIHSSIYCCCCILLYIWHAHTAVYCRTIGAGCGD